MTVMVKTPQAHAQWNMCLWASLACTTVLVFLLPFPLSSQFSFQYPKITTLASYSSPFLGHDFISGSTNSISNTTNNLVANDTRSKTIVGNNEITSDLILENDTDSSINNLTGNATANSAQIASNSTDTTDPINDLINNNGSNATEIADNSTIASDAIDPTVDKHEIAHNDGNSSITNIKNNSELTDHSTTISVAGNSTTNKDEIASYNNESNAISDINSANKLPSSLDSRQCDGRRVYMYNLPARYNTELMNQCNGSIVRWLNFCHHAVNSGLGPEVDGNGNEGWHATDLYMLEVVFHRRMIEYECLTNDPENAQVFYIPYYSGFDALKYLYGDSRDRPTEHGRDLNKWLENTVWWKRNQGKDHFMVTGRTTWDFVQVDAAVPPSKGGWGTALLEMAEFSNVTILAVEGRPWIRREQAIPYLTSFHPNSLTNLESWMERVKSSERKFLFSFVGGPRKGLAIRDSILSECRSEKSACHLVNCKEIKCSHNPMAVTEGLLMSEFCLQPPGDSTTRRSTFDGIIAGCIPVFFRNDSAYEQYTWHLPEQPESYSVFINESQVVEHGTRIEDVLRSFSSEKVGQLRANVLELLPRVLYRNVEASDDLRRRYKDAFDLSVDGMLHQSL